MALKFKWDITPEDWSAMQKNNKPNKELPDETIMLGALYYGSVYVGNLCFDILQFFDDGDESPQPIVCGDVFCLGKDTGYGYTVSKTPYDHVDFCPVNFQVCSTLAAFKRNTQKIITEYLESYPGLMAEAEKPLGNWE